jgi:hypothetical protein
MSILRDLDEDPGYLRTGILGFQGSGKTELAVELALGVRDYFGLTGPIAAFDTEAGIGYQRDKIVRRTGRSPIGVKSRSFADLMAFSEEIVGRASVAIVDSSTHIWREVCESYLRGVNDNLRRLAEAQRRPFVERKTLEKADWQIVKGMWARWVDWYQNAEIHLIVCGRAGYEYVDREDDEGNLESVKAGVKMKTESEFAFEHALLIEMARIQREDNGVHTVIHRANVLKDKFPGCLDGQQADDPDFSFFLPHVARLRPSGHRPIDVSVKTDHGVLGGDRSWYREKQDRTILAEEIDGELEAAHPGQTAAAKSARAELLHRVFGTYSKTAIAESTHSERLRRGLAELRSILRPEKSITDSNDPRDQIPDWSDDSCGDASTPPEAAPAPGAAAEASTPPVPAQVAAPQGETERFVETCMDALFRPLPPVDPIQERTSDPAPIPSGPEPPAKKKPGRKSKAEKEAMAAAEAAEARARSEALDAAEVDVPVPAARPLGSTLLDEDAEVHELELTVADMDPAWIESVEKRIRALPDARPEKSVLWGRLWIYKGEVEMARARAEAESRR